MEIAKGILSSDYLKLNLNQNLENNDWDVAIEYFEKRINERFIEPINRLIEFEREIKPSERKYGFVILAIDCLLLETIESFYEGITNSTGKSKQLFKKFLTTKDEFKNHFSNESIAEEFFIKFRCGLLHQAQTSEDTKIWTVGNLISQNEKYLIVNRDLFHKSLLKEFESYLKKLRKKDNLILMNHFKKKMDFISGK